MQRTLTHFGVLVAAFFGTWFLLSRIDFVALLHVESFSEAKEKQIGEYVMAEIRRHEDEIRARDVRACVDSIAHRLCEANRIADSSITIHVLSSSEVNAYALPGRHIIVTSGMIEFCHSPEELSGVVAHEIAHLELHHVSRKLAKEAGLSMITLMAGGNATGEMTRQLATMLSSTAFDRSQEHDADMEAVRYLIYARVDPAEYANVLFRFAGEHGDDPMQSVWMSTHPDSKDRAAEVMEFRNKEPRQATAIVDSTSWLQVQQILAPADDETENGE